jgi:serine/threonine protein kinase
MLVDDLTLTKPLGKGAFGEVFLTSKKGVKEKFATKIIKKKYFESPNTKKYRDREFTILKDIDHENIIKLYDVKETSQCFFLVLEYCNGGSLSDCLDQYEETHNAPFPEELVQYLMRQIVSALKYLHDKRIIHRILKLDNILIHYDSEEDRINKNLLKAKVKIIDFVFSRYLKKGELAYSINGSQIYFEPVILKKLIKIDNYKDYGYDEKADIWSLGNICYEMLIGKPLFDVENIKELVKKVERGNYFLPSTLSMEAASFINGMLKYDPTKRYTAEQLYRHQFLNKNVRDFHKINLNKIKENVIDSKIKMNTRLDQSIWDIVEEGFCKQILKGYENYNDKNETMKKMKGKDKDNNWIKNGSDTKSEETFENYRK